MDWKQNTAFALEQANDTSLPELSRAEWILEAQRYITDAIAWAGTAIEDTAAARQKLEDA